MPNTQKRCSLVGTLYHQIPGNNPTAFNLRSKLTLESDEEPYQRSPADPVGNIWQKLDLGWVTGCSILCIRNLAEPPKPKDPEETGTAEPLEEDNTLVLGFVNDANIRLRIPPGTVTVLYPTHFQLQICCPLGSAHYRLLAVPE